MFKQAFKQAFGSRADVRPVRAPWAGLEGFVFGTRRIDHRRFQSWTNRNRTKSPLIEAIYRATLKVLLASQLSARFAGEAPAPAPRPGFRVPPKPTRAQARAAAEVAAEAAEDAAAPGAVDLTAIAADTIDHLDVEPMLRANREDLNGVKPGVALHVIDFWEGPADDDSGEPLECSLVNRLHFLGWRGVLVLEEGWTDWDEAAESERGVHFLTEAEFDELGPDSALAGAIARGAAEHHLFHGTARDDSGGVFYVDAGQPFGPGEAGDVMTRFLLDASRAGQAYHAGLVADDIDRLGGTPAGGAGSSTA